MCNPMVENGHLISKATISNRCSNQFYRWSRLKDSPPLTIVMHNFLNGGNSLGFVKIRASHCDFLFLHHIVNYSWEWNFFFFFINFSTHQMNCGTLLNSWHFSLSINACLFHFLLISFVFICLFISFSHFCWLSHCKY